ncbi:uncharacterized protein LOC110811793 [Carica papaya]|uniref:uncharacterized protein LOC110811793 n=1 Tax=Carica papaya TaxID=3649 RepID=UPI000B8CE6A0|nr:uncharacterized protein LOC110811793 [Carica papaya]
MMVIAFIYCLLQVKKKKQTIFRVLKLDFEAGASMSLTYIVSESIIPGYSGGMSSAKAALESNTRVVASKAGRNHRIRMNTISAEEPSFRVSPKRLHTQTMGFNEMGVGGGRPDF